MIDFASLREDSAEAVSSLLEGLDPRIGREAFLQEVEALCLHFHILAVSTLLLDGDAQHFFLNLCRAAENWRRMLMHARAQGWPHPPATRNMPLLGAAAAGQWTLASEVAALSTCPWREGEEYEDDHCWALVLQELVQARQENPARIEALLVRMEALGGDAAESRLGMARGLLTGNQHAFLDAFTRALQERGEWLESRAHSFTTPVTKFAPHRYLWLEGLALLRLGERAGFKELGGYHRYCPPLARLPMRVAYTGDWAFSLGG